jgi:hypothetical protein
MFALAHDQHRTRRVAHDPLGGAAELKMLQSGKAVRGDDDEVNASRFRHLRDFMKRLAERDDGFGVNPAGAGALPAQLVQPCLRLLAQPIVLLQRGFDAEEIINGIEFDDVQEDEVRLEWLRKRDGVGQRLLGAVGKIQRHENFLRRECSGCYKAGFVAGGAD